MAQMILKNVVKVSCYSQQFQQILIVTFDIKVIIIFRFPIITMFIAYCRNKYDSMVMIVILTVLRHFSLCFVKNPLLQTLQVL